VTVSDEGLLPARVVADVAAWIELVPLLSGTLRAAGSSRSESTERLAQHADRQYTPLIRHRQCPVWTWH